MPTNESSEPLRPSGAGRPLDDEATAVAGHKPVPLKDRTSATDLLVEAHRARVRHGLTQKQVAAAMGTTQSAVSELESGANTPTLGTLLRYGWALGLNIQWTDPAESRTPEETNCAITLKSYTDLLSDTLTNLVVPTVPSTGRPTPRELSKLVQPFDEKDRSWVVKTIELLTKHELVEQGPDNTYTFAADQANVIGVSVNGHSLYGVLLDLDGETTQAEQPMRLPDHPSVSNVVNALSHVIKKLRGQSEKPVLGVGISIAGPVDSENGIVKDAPAVKSRRHDWRNIPLKQLLEQKLQDQTGAFIPVVIANDANALALQEHISSGEENTAAVLVTGVGVGAGIVSGGQLNQGANDAAGEIGHIIVDFNGPPCRLGYPHQGCVETVTTSEAILKKLGRPYSKKQDRKREMDKLNKSGELTPEIRFLIQQAGTDLRKAVSDLVLITDPHSVVIFAEPQLSNRDEYETARLYQEGFANGAAYVNHRRPDFIRKPKVIWRELADDTRARAACSAAFWEFLHNPIRWLPELANEVRAEISACGPSNSADNALQSYAFVTHT